jgi:hypothetical protein
MVVMSIVQDLLFTALLGQGFPESGTQLITVQCLLLMVPLAVGAFVFVNMTQVGAPNGEPPTGIDDCRNMPLDMQDAHQQAKTK